MVWVNIPSPTAFSLLLHYFSSKSQKKTMAMRELVTGAAACAVPGSSSSSSNPLGALANALIGSSSKPLVFTPFLFLSIHLLFSHTLRYATPLPLLRRLLFFFFFFFFTSTKMSFFFFELLSC